MKRELLRLLVSLFVIAPIIALGGDVGWPSWGRALAGTSMVCGIRWLISIGEGD